MLAGAVVLAFLALTVMAWLGSRAELLAARSRAQSGAEAFWESEGQEIVARLEAGVRVARFYADPPRVPANGRVVEVPESAEALTEFVTQGNGDAFTKSGLPARAVAVARLLEMGKMAEDMALPTLVKEVPSVLTSAFLPEGSEMMRRWADDELARAGGGEGLLVLSADEAGVAYLTKELVKEISVSPRLPEWGTLGVAEGRTNELAVAALSVRGQDLPVAVLGDWEVIEAEARQRRKWTLALLSGASATAGLALFALMLSHRRERQLAEQKSQFVASVSHELRAPLASIRLMAEALEAESVTEPQQFHRLISSESTRLSHLVENVLDSALIEKGQKVYEVAPFAIDEVLRQTLDLMKPVAVKEKVELLGEITEFFVENDAEAVQQAVMNLIDNAIKFSEPEARVSVGCAEEEEAWWVSVADEGRGIAAADQGRIFDRFQRLGSELRRESQGAGLGLSIVKHIAEGLGGRVEVESELGQGATFRLIFPKEVTA